MNTRKHYTVAQERTIAREMSSARNPKRKVQSLAKRYNRSVRAIEIKFGRLVKNWK